MSDVKIQKPFLKWVGGKTQIINNKKSGSTTIEVIIYN